MHVVIVGCGLAGVISAWYLRERGEAVTVIERQPGPALETSYANGALLHASLVDPWNAPGVQRELLRSIGRSTAPLLVRPRALPGLLSWGWEFLRNSQPERFRRNALLNLALAQHSRVLMERLRGELALDYDRLTCGALMLYRDPAALERGLLNAARLGQHGVRFKFLDTDGIVTLEPTLDPICGELAGGIYYPDDEGGDSHKFASALARHAADAGVRFRFGVAVSRLDTRGGRVRGVCCGDEEISADAVVLAAASHSAHLARGAGLALPIRPVKGYSVTVDLPEQTESPGVPVIDYDLHAAVVPVGDRTLRVAGTAEFAGFDLTIPPRRTANLISLLKRILPSLADELPLQAFRAWAGLRAVSADGVPILGRTRIENLFLNTGHGHLGWTLAAGAARLAADEVLQVDGELAVEPYRLERFH